MQGADQHIRSSFGLSILPKDTRRPGDSNQHPTNNKTLALPPEPQPPQNITVMVFSEGIHQKILQRVLKRIIKIAVVLGRKGFISQALTALTLAYIFKMGKKSNHHHETFLFYTIIFYITGFPHTFGHVLFDQTLKKKKAL